MNNVKYLISEITNELVTRKVTNSEYYKFGVRYLGPFLVGYIKWLHKTIKECNVEKVFFFSRDGYLMEKAFGMMDDTLDTEYVYFSRNSIRHAILHFCDSYESVISLLPFERYITTAYFLEFLGVSNEKQKVVSEINGVSLETCHKYDELINNVELKNIYISIKEEVNNYSQEQDTLLEKYLNQIGLYGKCAVVDIGWHGSMQYYLEKYCQYKNMDIELVGFYIGIRPNWPISGRVNGYLYNPVNLHMRKAVLCFFGGYEKFFQKGEGSTWGYTEREGKVLPLLYPFEYERDDLFNRILEDIQSGGLEFLEEVHQRNISIKDELEWAKPLIKFGQYPSNKELNMFKCFYNVDGKKAYYLSQKPIYKYGLRELKYALSDSVWKTGFMKSLFKVPFPYYWIYYLLRK